MQAESEKNQATVWGINLQELNQMIKELLNNGRVF